MSRQGVEYWYRRFWGEEIMLPSPDDGRGPFDEEAFTAAWQTELADFARSMTRMGFAVEEYISHPQLRALGALIRNRWAELDTPDAMSAALACVDKMQDQPMAVIAGYEQLQVALTLLGDSRLCLDVADRQQQYMTTNPDFKKLMERIRDGYYPLERHRLQDYIPGGLSEPPDPDAPFDEPAGPGDPFGH